MIRPATPATLWSRAFAPTIAAGVAIFALAVWFWWAGGERAIEQMQALGRNGEIAYGAMVVVGLALVFWPLLGARALEKRLWGPLRAASAAAAAAREGEKPNWPEFEAIDEFEDERAALSEVVDALRASSVEDAKSEGPENEAQLVHAAVSLGDRAAELAKQLAEVGKMASQASERSNSAASATTEMAASVQNMATGAEQLSSSIAEISVLVNQSETMAKSAVDDAKGANRSVEELVAEADQINEIVALISEIAEQTNLLALNATIEAARAGDAGKGFAVVAQEVKALAAQTAAATQKIETQISAMQTKSKFVAKAVASIDTAISELNSVSATIAGAVIEQDAAASDIAMQTQETSKVTNSVSADINGALDLGRKMMESVEQMQTACGELERQADALGEAKRAAS